MNRAAYGLLLITEVGDVQSGNGTRADVGVCQAPDAAQEAAGTLDAGIGPFQAHVRRRGEHHEQAAGICAVAVDHRLRVDTIVLRLRHLLGTADFHRQAITGELGTDDLGLGVALDDDVGRVEPVLAAIFQGAVVGVRDDHALREQVLERLVGADQPLVTHQLVEEARIEQMQDRVLDATDVLVYRQPVVGCGRIDHALVIMRRGIASKVPGRFDKGVHGVGFALGCGAAIGTAAVIELRHARQR